MYYNKARLISASEMRKPRVEIKEGNNAETRSEILLLIDKNKFCKLKTR